MKTPQQVLKMSTVNPDTIAGRRRRHWALTDGSNNNRMVQLSAFD